MYVLFHFDDIEMCIQEKEPGKYDGNNGYLDFSDIIIRTNINQGLTDLPITKRNQHFDEFVNSIIA